MRVLVHVCCGPCSIAVFERLLAEGHTLEGYFFNPNIQPLAEYMRRREGAIKVAEKLALKLICADTFLTTEQSYPAHSPVAWLRSIHGKEAARCPICWRIRMGEAARYAASHGYDGFTSSLLYSRYQDHAQLRSLGAEMAEKYGIEFIYQDFRTSWQDGITRSKEWGIYRQQYCGCIYSEYERYAKDFAKVIM